MSKLKAPFPYFGGKSKAVPLVWERFGKVDHYIEPFCGSMAMLLGCPDDIRAKRETVNDADCWLINAWRALKYDPEGVADALNEPLFELNVHAYARQCRDDREAYRERFRDETEYHDVVRAARWLSGMSASIGDAFAECKKALLRGGGACGVHKLVWRGKHADCLAVIRDRLRNVQIASGDWSRVLGSVHLFQNTKCTAVFLDPPYISGKTSDYAGGDESCVPDVIAWCREYGDDPRLRICLAGHDGDYALEGWQFVQWSRHGGYANTGGESEARSLKEREGLWFSPHCLEPAQQTLFGGIA